MRRSPPDVELSRGNFALPVIDPQVDLLSPNRAARGVVGQGVGENGTVENIERLFRTSKQADAGVFVSPHDYAPHDQAWKFEEHAE